MNKIRLATVWLDGCSGCHMSLLDMDERLIEIANRVDVVYSPLVDAKEFPEGVDVTLVEGAVGSVEDLEKIHLIRERTRILVSLGDSLALDSFAASSQFRGHQIVSRSPVDLFYRWITIADPRTLKFTGVGILPYTAQTKAVWDSNSSDWLGLARQNCSPIGDELFLRLISESISGNLSITSRIDGRDNVNIFTVTALHKYFDTNEQKTLNINFEEWIHKIFQQ